MPTFLLRFFKVSFYFILHGIRHGNGLLNGDNNAIKTVAIELAEKAKPMGNVALIWAGLDSDGIYINNGGFSRLRRFGGHYVCLGFSQAALAIEQNLSDFGDGNSGQ